MAGELTASTPTVCRSPAAIKTHIDTLILAAATDFIVVVPYSNVAGTFLVFKVERAT